MTDKTTKIRNTFYNLCAWFFGVIFLFAGLGGLREQTILALPLLILSILLIPPLYKALNNKLKTSITSKQRIISILILLVSTSILTRESKPNILGQVLTAQQNSVYNEILKEDFETTFSKADTLISKTDWYRVLNVKGKTTALNILKNFEKNEVSAT